VSSKRSRQNNQRAGDPAIEITKNLPDEAESHVGEETMTDPGSCNRSSFSLGSWKPPHYQGAPWVKPLTRSTDSRAQEILKKLEKKGEETRKFLTPCQRKAKADKPGRKRSPSRGRRGNMNLIGSPVEAQAQAPH
jgi:hypothetical protein